MRGVIMEKVKIIIAIILALWFMNQSAEHDKLMQEKQIEFETYKAQLEKDRARMLQNRELIIQQGEVTKKIVQENMAKSGQ